MSVAAVLLLLLVAQESVSSTAPVEPAVVDAFAVVATLDRYAEMELWPGFDPRQYPAAIYDGKRTLLLRHPSPPKEFQPVDGREGVWSAPGRHAAMRWNSTAEIGGVRTATLLLTIEPGRAVELEASFLLHELFHLYSKPRHPSWRPNEMFRYSYPMADVENYHRLILEEEALARSVEASSDEETVAWAAEALAIRRERTAHLAPEHLDFEIALEMQEGTAVYLAKLAVGTPDDTSRLRETKPPDGIRWRGYDTGAALAAILDRLDPGWKQRLEASPEMTLAELLERALAAHAAAPARFSEQEAAALRTQAESGIAELAARRQELYADFRGRGTRVVVEVDGGAEAMRFGQFDPLAIEILDDGEALHAHGFVLESASGRVELANPHYVRGSLQGVMALTTPAGAHPFLDGVRRVAISGFADEPKLQRDGDTVVVEAEGLKVSFLDAGVRISEGEIALQLSVEGSPGTDH